MKGRTHTSSESRQNARIPSHNGQASTFQGERAGILPANATVADVSEGGVRLLFPWPATEAFPLRAGDGLGFVLKVDDQHESFEILGVVRHIKTHSAGNQVTVGVEFTGLDHGARENLKKSLLHMAVTKLRAWQGVRSQDPDAQGEEPTAQAAARRRRLFLGEILVNQKSLDGVKLEEFLAHEYSGQKLLGQELMEHGLVDDRAVARALAEQSRLPFLDIKNAAPDLKLVASLPRDVFIKYRCVPIGSEGGAILVAMSAPPMLSAFEDLKTGIGRRIRVGIAPENDLCSWLKQLYQLETPRGSTLRFTVQLRVEYRIFERRPNAPRPARACVGLTREVSGAGMTIAGPLPADLTTEKIAKSKLDAEVLVEVPEIFGPLRLHCQILGIRQAEYSGEYLLTCRIAEFVSGTSEAWNKLCLTRGTSRIRRLTDQTMPAGPAVPAAGEVPVSAGGAPAPMDAGEDDDDSPGDGEDESTLARVINQIVEDAHGKGASDVHIEPIAHGDVQVRYRVDGVMRLAMTLPRQYRRAILSRLKIMADLDIAERRKPQSGKIRFRRWGNLDLEIRVETCPTAGNIEDAVLRLLSATQAKKLAEISLSERNLRVFKEMIVQPHGIILCVGPTGSGKTTTLHSALGHINDQSVKILTVEDPVEITQAGLRQVQINPRAGITFASALRSFLRSDPDVIMIGEMRDRETAAIAIEASLTGHLVFSTLHTNSAAETVVRLLEMGLDPYSFADALLGVLAQRLVRRLCPACRTSGPLGVDRLAEIRQEYGELATSGGLEWQPDQVVHTQRRNGCEQCSRSGFRGRMAVHELLEATDDVKALVSRRASAAEVRASAVARGMRTLRQDGIEKYLAGHTTMEEVRAVCSL
jgi:type II secretory ATPase GspE/PulE/Tfp pilus assembly ATPase PilB-like protein